MTPMKALKVQEEGRYAHVLVARETIALLLSRSMRHAKRVSERLETETVETNAFSRIRFPALPWCKRDAPADATCTAESFGFLRGMVPDIGKPICGL